MPIQNGELVIAQLLVGVDLPSTFDYHAIRLPRSVLGTDQYAATTLEVGHHDGRWQDADQVDLGTVPHRVCNGNNPIGTVCPTVFQSFQKDMEYLVFVRAAGLLAIDKDGHWWAPVDSTPKTRSSVAGINAALA